MKILEVHFNHDTGSNTGDALNIRVNAGGSPIAAPEWRDGLPSKPAAYATHALVNTITIKAKFSGGPPSGSVRIRAIDSYLPPAQPSGCFGWLFSWIVQLLRALFGNVLGDVHAKLVAFDPAGNSGLSTFTLVNRKLKHAPVAIRFTDWTWQMRQNNQWVTFGTTQHKIYLVLEIPAGPWDQNPAGNNTQLPWTDALDKACSWAFGATTKDEVAERITRAVNTHARQSYTPATMFGFNSYYLSSYLGQLDSGNPFVLNCTDCADAVTTMANLLGCNLWEGRFFNMQTRPFLTLGGDPSVLADWVAWGWSYHEICWLGAIGQNERIYDGCLQVDMDDNYNDNVHVAKAPIRMQFGVNAPDDYRYRLIESGTGQLENIPRRRAVS